MTLPLDQIIIAAEAATKTPWGREADPCHYDTLSSIVAADGHGIAEIGGMTCDEQDANAEYITLSANNALQMAKALKAAAALVEKIALCEENDASMRDAGYSAELAAFREIMGGGE